MFVCQVLCTGSQGISSLLPRGSIGQSRFICQVLCTGSQGISSQLPGGPLAKVVCLPIGIQGISPLLPRGSICQNMFVCQVLCTGSQASVLYTCHFTVTDSHYELLNTEQFM